VNFISKWFWKRAIKHEVLSLAKGVALVAGLVFIISAILGPTSLVLGLVIGVGLIILAGRLKHRLWSGGFVIGGLFAYAGVEGAIAQGGALLVVLAGSLGLLGTFI
jgi:4-hydroxybenzoate polyprenyltransferase